nr:MAG TPA: hypothetical protein [Caudoviricetes sp.]
MAKGRAKGMLISLDIRQQVELLSNEEAGELFKALLAYADDGTPMSTDNRLLSVVFAGLRTQLDASAENYAKRCEKNKAAILERWRKERKQSNTDEYECIQSNTNEYYIRKDNIRKDNIDIKKDAKASKEKTDGANAPHSALLDVNAFVAYFNEQLVAQGAIIKQVKTVTPKRRSVIEARARENGKEALKTVADKSASSDFLNGKNDRGWLATFDWLMRPNNFVKVLEGNFDNKNMAANNGGKNVNDLWQ